MKKQRIRRYFFLFAVLLALFFGTLLWKFFGADYHGLTLEQAQVYSSQNKMPVFLYRSSSDRYFPLTISLMPHGSSSSSRAQQKISTLFVDAEIDFPNSSSRVRQSKEEKLVYLSTAEKAPEKLTVYPITKSGTTIPALFETTGESAAVSSLVTPAQYNPSYLTYTARTFQNYNEKAGLTTSVLTAPNDPITIDGLPLEEYLASASVRKSLVTTSYSGAVLTQAMVDLTGSEEPVTIGYYSGTAYRTFLLKPDCRWLALDKSVDCPTILTQDGFAQIDLSALETDTVCYALQLPDTPFYFIFELAE